MDSPGEEGDLEGDEGSELVVKETCRVHLEAVGRCIDCAFDQRLHFIPVPA